MPRKNRLTQEDIELFRRTVGPVNPLRSTNRAVLVKKPKSSDHVPPPDSQRFQELTDLLDTQTPAETGANEALSFVRPGIQHSVFRKMRKGHLTIRSELDLHGLTAAQARRTLVAFLHETRLRGERCVRIIHGKGYNSPNRQPILKSRLNVWLRQCHDVLAFCSAPPNDGGTGVAYVLLRTA